MKPKENEHITTPQYQLPYSWDKGECLIAVFQTKSTQLRTRVRVKEVLKGNITHSSTVIKEYWNRPQNSISSFTTPSEGGKKSPKPINLLFSGPFLPPFLGLSTSMLVFNLSLLEEAASHFQDSGKPSWCDQTLHEDSATPGWFQSRLQQKAFTTEEGP